MSPSPPDITALLHLAQDPGNQQARADLYRLLETEIRRIAHARLREQPHLHSFDTTELAHEAWIRLLGKDGPTGEPRWQSRRHFFAAASRVIQSLLVDHYRKLVRRPRLVRGGLTEDLPDAASPSPAEEVERAERFLALHDALERLEQSDPNAAEVCRLRCFGKLLPLLFGREPGQGMKLQQVADDLHLPLSTVHSRWKRAVLFLGRELRDFAPEGRTPEAAP